MTEVWELGKLGCILNMCKMQAKHLDNFLLYARKQSSPEMWGHGVCVKLFYFHKIYAIMVYQFVNTLCFICSV